MWLMWTKYWTYNSGFESFQCIIWLMWTEYWTDYSRLERGSS